MRSKVRRLQDRTAFDLLGTLGGGILEVLDSLDLESHFPALVPKPLAEAVGYNGWPAFHRRLLRLDSVAPKAFVELLEVLGVRIRRGLLAA